MAKGSGGAYLKGLPTHANWHETGGIDEMSLTDLAGTSINLGVEAAARIAADAAHAALLTAHGLHGELAFRVYKTGAAQVFAADAAYGNVADINWTHIEFDTGGDFDLANEWYEAPIDCKLLSIVSCDLDALSGPNNHWRIMTYIGLFNLAYQQTSVNDFQRCELAFSLLDLTAGDHVHMQLAHNDGGAAANLNAGQLTTWWAGFVIPQST